MAGKGDSEGLGNQVVIAASSRSKFSGPRWPIGTRGRAIILTVTKQSKRQVRHIPKTPSAVFIGAAALLDLARPLLKAPRSPASLVQELGRQMAAKNLFKNGDSSCPAQR